jgi:acetyl esterase/lipase
MRRFSLFLLAFALVSIFPVLARAINRDIPYAEPTNEKQTLDIYAPAGAKDLPVLFWIHGGGWQIGDKADVKAKPQAFLDKGFVFVSINYRLQPAVDMGTLIGDVAKAFRWVQDHIAEHGGDPKRVLVAGHSAGAQLSALICTDERYLKAEGLGFGMIKGCVPVDGDTFDVPAIVATTETRRRAHGLPLPTFSDRQKFGDDPEKFRDFSSVNHVAKGKGIPPFLLLHVADHPDTSIQSRHLAAVLKAADVPVTVFAAPDTNHTKLNDHLGLPDDPATKALFDFAKRMTAKDRPK